MGHFVTVIHLQNNRNTVYTVKPAQVVTSIKKSPVLNRSPFSCPVVENLIRIEPLKRSTVL